MPYTPAQFKPSQIKEPFKPLWNANNKDRAKYLSIALKRSDTDFNTVLLFYLVLEFKLAPTKTKFYAIYDGYFLGQVNKVNKGKKLKGVKVSEPSKRAPTKFPKELEHNYNHTYTQLTRLAEMAETVEALSDISKNKSLLDRILTSYARKIPSDIFDDLIGEIISERGKDPVADDLKFIVFAEPAFEDFASIVSGELTIINPNFAQDLKTVQGELAALLKKAGFDMKKLGIADMKAP